MARSYVAIDDSVHHLLRTLTRRTLLVSHRTPDGECTVGYQVDERQLPDEYFSLAMLHALGGVPQDCLAAIHWSPQGSDRIGIPAQVDFFNAVRLDRRCARDLRLKVTKKGSGLLSAELL